MIRLIDSDSLIQFIASIHCFDSLSFAVACGCLRFSWLLVLRGKSLRRLSVRRVVGGGAARGEGRAAAYFFRSGRGALRCGAMARRGGRAGGAAPISKLPNGSAILTTRARTARSPCAWSRRVLVFLRAGFRVQRSALRRARASRARPLRDENRPARSASLAVKFN